MSLFTHTAIGIDVGDTNLKCAVLKNGLTTRINVEHLILQPIEPGVVEHGMIQQPQAFQRVIANILKTYKLHTTEPLVSVAIPEEKVYATSLPLPEGLTEADVPDLIEQHFPLQAKEAEVRSTLLTPTDGESRLVLMATPRVVVDGVTAACDAAGVHLGAIEFDTLALMRLLRTDGIWPEFLLVVDIGARHATVAAMNVSAGIFSELSLTSLSGEAMADGVNQTQVDVFSKDVEQFLSFLQSHHQISIPLDLPVILVGGGARAQGLGDLLQTALKRPVQSWRPSSRFRLPSHAKAEECAPFAVSMGTALRFMAYE